LTATTETASYSYVGGPLNGQKPEHGKYAYRNQTELSPALSKATRGSCAVPGGLATAASTCSHTASTDGSPHPPKSRGHPHDRQPGQYAALGELLQDAQRR
jgi:hypothetical protein